MRRVRNLLGQWGYCKSCGEKVYQTEDRFSDYLCSAQCGYMTRWDVKYNTKNVRKLK